MNWIAPSEPRDAESLRKALETVIVRAYRNGVPIERDWRCQGDGGPDWNVDVVRLDTGGENGAE